MAIAIPRTTTDIAAVLRRELDESEYKRGELQRQVEGADLRNAKLHAENVELQRQVDEVRGLLISSADDFVSQRRTSFLAKAYHESRMLNAQLRLDIEKHKRWHLEHGQEAGRLQSEIAAARDENGKLTRLLEASEERVLQIEAERDESRTSLNLGTPS